MSTVSRQPILERVREAGGARGGSLAPVLALAALTVIGFALRAVGMDQALFNDERFTYTIVTENGLYGVLRDVYHTSITPPLNYVLAWFSVHLPGDDTILVRLPSLLFGTAMIPLLFALARRIGGVRAGLLAAALVALGPFAIYYSDEARTYEVMVFLVALSTLALLRAEGGGGSRWWVVYAVSACAAVWGHYTAVFVLAAQFAWAAWAHRERLRALLIAQAGIVVGYLPWVPGYLEQRNNQGVELFDSFKTESLRDIFELPIRTLIGHPFLGLDHVPGTAGLLLLAVLAALLVAAIIYRPAVMRDVFPSLRSTRTLMLILALATPVGMLLYGRVGPSIYGARNLSASQPAFFVFIALLLDRLLAALPRRLAVAAAAALAAVLGVIAVQSVGADNQRPPYREVAHYLDENAAGDDPVVDAPLILGADNRLGKTSLETYFERGHPLYTFFASAAAWRAGSAGRTVFLVTPEQTPVLETLNGELGINQLPPGVRARRARLGGLDGRAIARGKKTFAGFYPITVRLFRGAVTGRLQRRSGRQLISWSFGERVTVAPGVAKGLVERASVPRPGAAPTLAGWALDAARGRPADWVLLFSRRRLIAASAGGERRPDVGKITGGSEFAGFSLSPSAAPPGASALRAFAIVGTRASELPLTPAAKQALSRR